MTGIPLVVGQISAQKNIQINERFKFQVRLDFRSFMEVDVLESNDNGCGSY